MENLMMNYSATED